MQNMHAACVGTDTKYLHTITFLGYLFIHKGQAKLSNEAHSLRRALGLSSDEDMWHPLSKVVTCSNQHMSHNHA